MVTKLDSERFYLFSRQGNHFIAGLSHQGVPETIVRFLTLSTVADAVGETSAIQTCCLFFSCASPFLYHCRQNKK